MFNGKSIAQKEAQGAFTKNYFSLVACFEVGAFLFLIFLFDFFEFFAFLSYLPSCFLTLRSVQSTIAGVNVDLIGLTESTVSSPMVFYII